MNSINKYCLDGGRWYWQNRPKTLLARIREYLNGVTGGGSCLYGGIVPQANWHTATPRGYKRSPDDIVRVS